MKSSAWDNKLWQNKMQEIPLDRDADLAWSEMQGLLDKVMPVTPAIKKPWGLGKTQLLTIAYAAAAAAAILFAAYFLLKKQHQKAIKQPKENVKPAIVPVDSAKQPQNERDSATGIQPGPSRVKADSLNAASSAKNNVNAATVNGNKAIPVNSNNKKGVIDDTLNSQSRHQGTSARSRSTTGNLQLKYANNASIIKGHNRTHNNTPRTRNLAALSTSSAVLTTTGNHRFGNRRSAGVNHSNWVASAATSHTNNADPNGNKKIQADVNASKTNGLVKPNGASSTQKGNNPVNGAPAVQLSKADSAKATANKGVSTQTTTTANNTASVKNKPAPQLKPSNDKRQAYSKFEVAIEAGTNSGKGSTTPFVGLSGSYAVDPKFSISIGGNIFSSRTITGKYTIGKYQYTTQDDSTGIVTSHTAKNLVVSTSQKLYTVEIPLMASYKLNKWLTIKGGPLLSIPIKTGPVHNTLAPVGSPLDTARAFKALSSTVNSTTILNKATFNLSGGMLININRLYFDASYIQETGSYFIYSPLGGNEVHYHYLQLGIGYKLFRSKPKPDHN